MPAIKDRSEENAKRRNRLAKQKKGPGTFVYDGSLCDTIAHPQPRITGHQEPVFDASGAPVIDASGRQVYQRAGLVVRDIQGRPVLGGPPKIERVQLDTYKCRGVEFPKGEPIHVGDASLALKLRGMDGFAEVEAIEVKEADSDTLPVAPELGDEAAPVAPKRRGRPPKAHSED